MGARILLACLGLRRLCVSGPDRVGAASFYPPTAGRPPANPLPTPGPPPSATPRHELGDSLATGHLGTLGKLYPPATLYPPRDPHLDAPRGTWAPPAEHYGADSDATPTDQDAKDP